MKISKEKQDQIINYFYSHHNNTDKAIAEIFNLPRGFVSHILAVHLDEKRDRINNRVNKNPS